MKNPQSPSLKTKRRQARAKKRARFKGLLLSLGLLITGVLLYFRYAGLPMALVAPPLETLKEKGLELTWSHSYISVFQGLVFHEAELIIHEGLVPFVARVEDLSISVNPFKMHRPSRGIRELVLEAGVLEMDLTQFSAEAGKVFRWQCALDSAALRLSDDGYILREVTGKTMGMKFHAQGSIHNLQEAAKLKQGTAGSKGEQLQKLKDGGQTLTETLRWLEQIEFSGEPKLEVSFDVNRAHPELNIVDVSLETHEEYVIRGMGFDWLDLKARAANGKIRIEEFESGLDGGAIQLSGLYDWGSREVEGKGCCDVDLQYIQPLLPVSWVEKLQQAGLTIQGEVVADFVVPLSPLDRLGQFYSGSLELRQTEVKKIWVDDLTLHVAMDNERLAVSKIVGRLGKGAQAGPVKGDFNLRLADKYFSAHLETGCAPEVLVPGVKGSLQNILRSFDMNGAPPQCVLDFSGRAGVKGTLVLEGYAEGEDLAYRGVPLEALATSFAYSNGVVSLPDLAVERREGRFDGLVELDLQKKTVALDALSTLHPEMTARMVSSKFEDLLRPLAFQGESFVKLKGLYDYGKNNRHDLMGSMYVEDAGVDRLLLEDCYFFFEARDNVFTFSDVRGMVEGGEFSGFLQLMDLDDKGLAAFFMDVGVHGADLKKITAKNVEGKENLYSGKISMRMDLEGRLAEQWQETLKGQGELKIEDGELYKIPLLGGLSKLLSKVIPGFGFTSQTDFTTVFEIGDEKIKVDPIALEGSVLSVKGKGSLGFDRRLNVKVQVKPLRDGLVADVVRTVFFPISKLFEFRLGGTLDKPDWRPDNLPKELFFIFD